MLKKATQLFFSKAITQLLGLSALIYFARSVSQSTLGEYLYFIALLGAVGIAADLGLSGAAEKFVSEKRTDIDDEQWHSSALASVIALSIVVTIGLAMASFTGLSIISQNLVPYFGLALIAGRVVSHYTHILRAELKAGQSGLLKLCQQVVFLVLAAGLIQTAVSYPLILAAVVSRIFAIPIAMLLVSTSITIPDLESIRELLSFGVYYSINVVSNKAFSYTDVIIIGLFLTAADVARYEVAWRLVAAIMMLNNTLATTAFSYISRAGSVDPENAVDDIQTTIEFALLLPLPVFVGVSIIGDQLIHLLFTRAYTVSPVLMITLGAGLIFQAIYYPLSKALIAIGRPRQAFVATVVAVVTNVGANVLLIPRFGILGGAIATTVSFFVAALIYSHLLNQVVSLEFPIRTILVETIAALLMGIVLIESSNILPDSPITVVGLIIIGALTYFVAILASPSTRHKLSNVWTGENN